jgi:thiol-disulfide isomerase/thioredoxin
VAADPEPRTPAPARPGRRAWLQAAAGAAVVAGLGREFPLHAHAQPARRAAPLAWPEITLLDGRVLEPADWQDTAAVVVFWATYCGFCQRHNVHLERLHRSLGDRPLRVLAMALDTDAGQVRHYMRQHGFSFAVSLDAARLRPLLSPRRIIPLTCTVDRQGRPLGCIPGEMAGDDVMELADRTLRGA